MYLVMAAWVVVGFKIKNFETSHHVTPANATFKF